MHDGIYKVQIYFQSKVHDTLSTRICFLTDEQWKVLQPILEPPQAPRRGRPWKDGRAVLEAIFSFCTRASSGSTCRRVFLPSRRCMTGFNFGVPTKPFASLWRRSCVVSLRNAGSISVSALLMP